MDKLGPYLLGPHDTPENGIYTGDARELAKAIPDESVDLIFTDPVYDRVDDYRWLAETGARALKPSGQLAFYQAHIYYLDSMRAIDTSLKFRWIGTEQKIGTQTTIWGQRVLCRTRHVFFYYKPPAIFNTWLVDYINRMPDGKGNHIWSKHSGIEKWIKQLEGEIIFDPFAGGGTVPAVCKMLGRRYLAFEIDPDTAELARKRVRQTQPPLPGLITEQLPMELECSQS